MLGRDYPINARTVLIICVRQPYIQAQSMCARLCTLFATQGTTVELTWGNSLRNIWYYEDKVRRFVCIRLNLSCVCVTCWC